MKKQLVIIGIIAILVTVGLSGCSNISITNIGDITTNPQNYVGKKVTIEGTCSSRTGYGMIVDENGHIFYLKYSNTLYGKYRLSGTSIKDPRPFSSTGYLIDVETATAI